MAQTLEKRPDAKPQNGSLNTETSWTHSCTVASADEIVAFAMNLRTKNRGHLDHEVAVGMGYRTIFAPGGMIYSFIEEAVTRHAPRVVLREINLKFRNPLYAPALVTVECTVTNKDRAGTTVLVKVRDESGILAFGTFRILEPLR